MSIIIPAYNEAESLTELYRELSSVLASIPYKAEMIFVDDGSTDGTLEIITHLASKDKRIKALSFSRNFGHQAALIAGIEAAQGAAVITMDADLQHPPRLIPDMIKHWNEGHDVVYTIRRDTPDVSSFKLAAAKLFYRLMSRIANVDLPSNTADFRLISRPVVDKLMMMEERSLFLRGLIHWVGFKRTSIAYDASSRHAGKTKYSLRKMLQLAVNGITSFSDTPLLIALYFGFIVSALSFLYAFYVLYMRLFTTESLPGWASILVAVLFLGGVQLITLGIVGLYLGKLYEEVKHRPRYIVQSTVGDVGDVR